MSAQSRGKWLIWLALVALAWAYRSSARAQSAQDSPVHVESYALEDDGAGDRDGLVDPGEAISLTVTLANDGPDTLSDVQATIATPHPLVTFTHTTVITYGTLVAEGSKTAARPFRFSVDERMPRGEAVTFTLTISATGAGPWLDEVVLPVGWWRSHLPLLARNHVADRIPNDVHYPLAWAWPLIRAPKAWMLTTGDPAVVIAVLDTGVDLDHPDLLPKLWLNVDEVPGNGLDDDGNGYVDDVHGYDFWYDDPFPEDGHGHGTQVAGIAAAATDNEIGVAALGWDSTLMPLQTQSRNGWGTTDELAEAILYAVDNGAGVINISVGQELTLCPADLQAAIDYADGRGILVVAAVGNQDLEPDKDFYPAGCDNVLGVAATTSWDGRIGSDFGTYVDVAAPGHSLYTTARGGGYDYASGASMAAPLVSGLAALLYDHRAGYSDQEVAWAILGNAVDLGSPGKDVYYGWGRVDAYPALLQGAVGTPDY